MNQNFEPVLLFDSDDPEFARGVEIGRLYAALDEQRPELLSNVYHERNREMLERVAASVGYRLTVHKVARGWIKATFLRKPVPGDGYAS